MKALTIEKKIFVRFFTKSRLFADDYQVIEGGSIPRQTDIPDLEVKSRELSDLDFWIPDDAVGFVFFEIITAQVEDNGETIQLSSAEINKSGRHFFQSGKNFGRIATRDETTEKYDRHTYIRRYASQPVPEKIILYVGPQYYAYGYYFSGRRGHHTRESKNYICAFDFLEADVVVPIWYNFAQGYMIRAFAEKKGWVKKRAA